MEEYFNKVLLIGEDDDIEKFSNLFINGDGTVSFDNIIVEPVVDTKNPILVRKDLYESELISRGLIDLECSEDFISRLKDVVDYDCYKKLFVYDNDVFDLHRWRQLYWGCTGDVTDTSLAEFDSYEFCTPNNSCESFLLNITRIYQLEARLLVTSEDEEVRRFFRCKNGKVLKDCHICSNFEKEYLWNNYTDLEIAELILDKYGSLDNFLLIYPETYNLQRVYKYINRRTSKIKSKYKKVKVKGKYIKFNLQDLKFKFSYK